MAIKDILRQARERAKLMQDEAAEMIGVSKQTLSKWENGKTEPKASQVHKIAEIYKISADYLCAGKVDSGSKDPMEFMRKLEKYGKHVGYTDYAIALWGNIRDENEFFNELKELSEKPMDEESKPWETTAKFK